MPTRGGRSVKKLLNTLFISTQDVYLRQEGEAVAIIKDHTTLTRFPLHALAGIVTFGNVSISPYLAAKCAEIGLTLSCLDIHGHFLARITGPISGNVKLRLAQVHAYDNAIHKGEIARSCLIGKLINTRAILLRRIRDHGETTLLRLATEKLLDILRRVRDSEPDAKRLRGLEGEAAAQYFAAFNDLLVPANPTFNIASRSRRPPLDPMNALLSYLYTLLAHDCRGACEAVGLDPQIGFLHEIRPGRMSLALDLMEEFRPLFADRLALTLVNLKQLTAKDFVTTESGAILLKDEARKTLLTAWQKRKLETARHPYLGDKVPLGLFPHLQALLLARHLRGDLDAYPPFIAK